MSAWPPQPIIHEVNTWAWLNRLGRRRGRHVTLADVAEEEWDEIILPGGDAVWLMGVWERSPIGRRVALTHPGLQEEYRRALPDVTDDDVVGSPYAVRRYSVDPHLGGDEGLAAARAALARRGTRLIVDHVPNHVAIDHPWVDEAPQRLLPGEDADLHDRPDEFTRGGAGVFALGRDPYFPPWQDVLQLNAFSADLRTATVATLASIAERADGVRCDMAMLMLNEVFSRTWGERAGPPPPSDFWPEIIGQVRAAHPHFLFVAESYWDLEPVLLAQGFDHCYDKRLYDRLVHRHIDPLLDHLGTDPAFQQRLLRFLENHDEPRAAAVLPDGSAGAFALALLTLPGGILLHHGQLEGWRRRLPVQLARLPDEPGDDGVRRAYRQALALVADSGMRSGTWSLAAVDPIDGSPLLAWWWAGPAVRHLVVLNLSPSTAAGHVTGPWETAADVTLTDLLTGASYDRSGADLASRGLFVRLDGWSAHVLAW